MYFLLYTNKTPTFIQDLLSQKISTSSASYKFTAVLYNYKHIRLYQKSGNPDILARCNVFQWYSPQNYVWLLRQQQICQHLHFCVCDEKFPVILISHIPRTSAILPGPKSLVFISHLYPANSHTLSVPTCCPSNVNSMK